MIGFVPQRVYKHISVQIVFSYRQRDCVDLFSCGKEGEGENKKERGVEINEGKEKFKM